jgi:hypothetical protein
MNAGDVMTDIKIAGWEDMSEEQQHEAAASYQLGTKLLAVIKREVKHLPAPLARDVASNAALNALAITLLNYPDPNVAAETMAEALLMHVLTNAREGSA